MEERKISYAPYSPGDEIGIIELLKLSFERWTKIKNPTENWRWKHLEGPIPSEVYVAKDGEKIVGVNHRIMLNIKIGDPTLRSGYGDEVAVHPDYRGYGIWKNLKIKADEKNEETGLKFDYLATENPIVKDNIVKMGYTPSTHYMSQLLYLRDKESFLKRKNRDDITTWVGVTAVAGVGEFKKIFSTTPKKIEDYDIIEVPKFDHRIDEFWDRIKQSYGYSIVKKADYLNWRYSRPTISEHRIRLAVNGEEVQGYSVTSLTSDDQYSEGSISDLVTMPDRLDIADALIKDDCDYFAKMDAAAIHFKPTKGHPHEKLALSNGFIDVSSQKKTYFYYRVLAESIPEGYIEKLHPSMVQLGYF